MKPLRSEIQFLAYLLNTGELSMEGIILFIKHAGYRVRHIPSPPIPEKNIDAMSVLPEDHVQNRYTYKL